MQRQASQDPNTPSSVDSAADVPVGGHVLVSIRKLGVIKKGATVGGSESISSKRPFRELLAIGLTQGAADGCGTLESTRHARNPGVG